MIPQYKSLRDLLNEICSKIAPRSYDDNGNIIPVSTQSNASASQENANSDKINTTAQYGFTFIQKKQKIIISFFYKDPYSAIDGQSVELDLLLLSGFFASPT